MTINKEDLFNSIMQSLERIDYINADDIPNIDLYMDQVTTYMDSRLHATTRYPMDDKILTKTMINNYAKNDLLPPPIKKKYSKEHVLILIFIYYLKNILSISDIQKLINPITDKYFEEKEGFRLEDLYNEVVGLERLQVEQLKDDVKDMFLKSEKTFSNAPDEDIDFLHRFAFICLLSTDVYVKKLLIEKLVDELDIPEKKSSDEKKADEPGEEKSKDKEKAKDKSKETKKDKS